MHPVLVFAGNYGPSLASWIFANRDQLRDACARVLGPVTAAITDPSASIDRIGSALVAQQKGQLEVLGLLHQHTTKLDGISAAVDGVGVSVDKISTSIGFLTSLSFVGLGLSALSQVHIAFQFQRLTNRLKRLEAEIHELKEMMQADFRSETSAGLTKLKNGNEAQTTNPEMANTLFHGAIGNLTNSSARYIELLNSGVGAKNPQARWMFARHLIVSVLGEVAAYTRLGHPGLAVKSIELGLAPLRQHARSVFERTVAGKPSTFLMPAMAEHGFTLEALAELYRQAQNAGVLDRKQVGTAADLFESLRGHWGEASDPFFGKAKKVQQLRVEFAEASAAIEEVNRLQGLALVIGQYGGTGQSYLDLSRQILEDIEAQRPEEGACFAVFPNTPG